MDSLCRDCINVWITEGKAGETSAVSCPVCHSTRIVVHNELTKLHIAHIDCDAFYAAVEKRDNPSIRGKPVIVGGSSRGVVAAACYVARISGVRSAMPMFKAREFCPNAVVIPPNMKKYTQAGKQVRELMEEVTPLVEPLSIDEAFLDLSGTQNLHRMCPAETVIRLATRIENEIGISVSIGLSYNKFLAKIASDLHKPKGFSIIGQQDAMEFLKERSLSTLWGVGNALKIKLEKDGIYTIGDLLTYSEADLTLWYGAVGKKLYNFARGQDSRKVNPSRKTKNISIETTFSRDLSDPESLTKELWCLTDKLAQRLKKANVGCSIVNLKLKTTDFKTITRSQTLPSPTQMADDLYAVSRILLNKLIDGRKFRLIGVGASKLVPASDADQPDLGDPDKTKRLNMDTAIDKVRDRFGISSIKKGINFK